MDKIKVKRYTAIIEIILYFFIGVYFITNTAKKYYIEELKRDNINNRQNPAFMGISDSPKKMLNGIIGQKVKSIFKEFLGFLEPVLKTFTRIFGYFKQSINRLRNLLRPIRDFMKSIVGTFYNKIQNFTIGILYSLHKIRNSMKRTVSGFNLMIHSLEHSKNSLESLVKSPPMKLAVSLGEAAEFVNNSAGKLFCFDGNTKIGLYGNRECLIKDIEIGDMLNNKEIVIAKQKFINNTKLYEYQGILLTGNHIVKEDDKWIFVKNSLYSTKTDYNPEYVYCISTTNSEIHIDDIVFKDYSEVCDRKINYTINSLILMYLNKDLGILNNHNYAYEVKYNDCGFIGSTRIELDNGTYKEIKDIQIGDILLDDNKVIGKVELCGSYFKFYNDRNIIVTSNMKTKFAGIWRNVENTPADIINITPIKAYNIVTQNGKIPVFFAKEYRDYIELENPEINNAIDNIILNT